MRLRHPLLLALALAFAAGAARAEDKKSPLEALEPLVGQWEGEGAGQPGATKGAPFEFRFELEGRLLVRRSSSDYPAHDGRKASHHEDLLVIWADEAKLFAKYWDNEGHVIDYAVTHTGSHVQFLSSGAPAFRLIYELVEKDSLKIEFGISPAGKPDGFKTYLSGTARRIHK
jgi:hypothetical protein